MSLLVITACSTDEEPQPNRDIIVEDLTFGPGAVAVEGDTVTFHYLLMQADPQTFVTLGTLFESSYENGVPAQAIAGPPAGTRRRLLAGSFYFSTPSTQFDIPAGVTRGLIGAKEGGRRRIIVPPELAYGFQNAYFDIPPGAWLSVEVEILDVQ